MDELARVKVSRLYSSILLSSVTSTSASLILTINISFIQNTKLQYKTVGLIAIYFYMVIVIPSSKYIKSY